MNRIADLSNLQQLLPGTVLRINRGLYDHVALLGERAWTGERHVLSFGPGPTSLVEMPFSQFAGDRAVVVDGYPGRLAPEAVLARARQVAARRRYSWLGFNCEHFVRTAHDVAVESPQLARAFFLGMGAVLLTS
ncbi:hypothetical protein [Variovorax sp. GT1P44]|uniref:hypothetical protein n=1 Tax=Variovorax sp. GT1P44 TaxID=3443742 RepID=UPI003F47764C